MDPNIPKKDGLLNYFLKLVSAEKKKHQATPMPSRRASPQPSTSRAPLASAPSKSQGTRQVCHISYQVGLERHSSSSTILSGTTTTIDVTTKDSEMDIHERRRARRRAGSRGCPSDSFDRPGKDERYRSSRACNRARSRLPVRSSDREVDEENEQTVPAQGDHRQRSLRRRSRKSHHRPTEYGERRESECSRERRDMIGSPRRTSIPRPHHHERWMQDAIQMASKPPGVTKVLFQRATSPPPRRVTYASTGVQVSKTFIPKLVIDKFKFECRSKECINKQEPKDKKEKQEECQRAEEVDVVDEPRRLNRVWDDIVSQPRAYDVSERSTPVRQGSQRHSSWQEDEEKLPIIERETDEILRLPSEFDTPGPSGVNNEPAAALPGKQPSKQEVTQSTVEPTPILETSRAEEPQAEIDPGEGTSTMHAFSARPHIRGLLLRMNVADGNMVTDTEDEKDDPGMARASTSAPCKEVPKLNRSPWDTLLHTQNLISSCHFSTSTVSSFESEKESVFSMMTPSRPHLTRGLRRLERYDELDSAATLAKAQRMSQYQNNQCTLDEYEMKLLRLCAGKKVEIDDRELDVEYYEKRLHDIEGTTTDDNDDDDSE